jgi:hypothetical protein
MTEVADSISENEKKAMECGRDALLPSIHTSSKVGATAIVVAGILVGLVLGIRDMQVVLVDDAAITLRYAARIAAGDGWTYNDGDHTNGASAPLYTLVLTTLHLIGLNLETAAKAVGVVCFAATFGLAARIAHRIAGPVAGVCAIVLIAGSTEFRTWATSGMESALAASLGLAAILATTYRREWLAGVLVGLAVVNKLDAGFLAIAIAIGVTAAYRRFPWRLVAAAVATFAPWAIFSQLYFGSVLPHSASEKLVNEAKWHPEFDHWWVLKRMLWDHEGPALALAIAALAGVGVLLLRRQQALAAALLALVLWPMLHIVAFSFLNFGGAYGWYTAVLYPPTTVAAACVLGLIVRSGWRQRSIAVAALLALVLWPILHVVAFGYLDFGDGYKWYTTFVCPATTLAAACTLSLIHRSRWQTQSIAAALLLGIGITVGQHLLDWRKAAGALIHAHTVDDHETLDQTRREAGIFLGQVARPGDVVVTCYGWTAYGALQTTIAEACPLSTRKPVATPRWQDGIIFRDIRNQPIPGFHLVRSFISTSPDGGSTQIYQRDGS